MPFSLLKAIAFLQNQTVLETQRTAVFFEKGLSASWGDKCNIYIESRYSPFYFYIHFRYSLPKVAACYEHEYRREIFIHN